MSLLQELENQLKSTEERITSLVQNIEQAHELEQSFERARNGFDQASTDIGELAKSTEAAVKSLQETVDVLRSAINILERSDPERAHKVLKDLSKRLSREQADSTKSLKQMTYLLLILITILLGTNIFFLISNSFT